MKDSKQMGIIKIGSIKNAYCNACNMPSITLTIKIRGWDHELRICEHCLDKLAKILVRK